MRCLAFCFLSLGILLPAMAFDHTSPEWQRIGYWEGGEGSWKSVARGNFFLSPNGANSPQAEWEADLASFRQNLEHNSFKDEDAICRFPARFFLLAPLLSASPTLPQEKCPRFGKWFKQLSAKSLTLIFASAYINSPSSMYGHTMLRLDRGGITEGQALLDNVLSYAANPGNAGGISYMVLGLSGGFPGNFSLAPFYLKVNEYSNLENREFWEYRLKFSQSEVDFLASHIWELQEVNFAYYFLKRNCSYYLLRLLEVAKPNISLAKRFSLWAIPVDTIRALADEGLVAKREFRASRWQRVAERREHLKKEARRAARVLSEGQDLALDDFSRQEQVDIIDAAYEYFRFKVGVANPSKPEDKRIELLLLKKRAGFAIDSKALKFEPVPPDESHRTQRLTLGAGAAGKSSDTHGMVELRYRSAFHDLLQDTSGFEPSSELVMGDFRLRSEFNPNRVYLERADILRILSLAPLDSWSRKISWNISFGYLRAKDFACSSWGCGAEYLDGGGGITLAMPWEKMLSLSLLGNLSVETGPIFGRGYRIGAGPRGLLRWNETPALHTVLEGQWRAHLAGDRTPWTTLKLTQSMSFGRNQEISVEAEKLRTYNELALNYGICF